MVYTITTTDGRKWNTVYRTELAAVDAVALAYGWDEEAYTSSRYAVDGGYAVNVYATQRDCDADRDSGAHAPRITRNNECVYCAAAGQLTAGENRTGWDPDRDGLPKRTVYACDECHGIEEG